MKITEKLLLDGYIGQERGIGNISRVGSVEIHWHYRRGQESDGYNPVRLHRVDASVISLEYDRHCTIGLMPTCANHPALAEIERDVAEIIGDEVRS